MPDRVAVQRSGLWQMLKRLPPEYVVIGDAAYPPTEQLVPLFFGDAAKRKEYDNFNYYGSQCRIRIEMAFGVMARKWSILLKPYTGSLYNVPRLWKAIARLHNFVIDERPKENQEVGPDEMYYNRPTTIHHRRTSAPIDEGNANNLFTLAGYSAIRLEMINHVQKMGLRRPTTSKHCK